MLFLQIYKKQLTKEVFLIIYKKINIFADNEVVDYTVSLLY